MKLGTKGRYAVMAAVDIAYYGNKEPVALSAISARQGISISYLEQIFIKLRRAKIVESIRGINGGYRLARTPSKISMADIIQAVDTSLKATRCTPKSSGCMTDGTRCLVHHLWEGLSNQVQSYLASVTLEDVVQRRVNIPLQNKGVVL